MARGITIALALSLVLNVFAGGVLAGKWFAERDNTSQTPHFDKQAAGPDDGPGPRRGPPHGRPPPPHGGDILGETLALSPEARAAVRKAARGKGYEIRRDWEEMKQRRTAVRAALSADPFDRAAAEKALQDLIALRGTLEGGRMGLMLDVFESLSADERQALVEAQEERINERRGRRRPFRGPPPMDERQ
ncbi:MAG: periplasmic heavy metal sensor [Pseudomonadota bacterium]